MATVYLAEDLKHDRKVAIKVLRPALAAVIGAERFLSEIKTTAALQHPHILPLHDSGTADSFLFYVMPFVEGESLRDRLTREKQLPIADAVRIATEVASALDYAHRHNVIHRDIKPENILLHDGRALVADFGIALAASRAGGTRMTETGMSLGTPTYMSPEQAMGEREITGRSDVFSLGVVTYEMLLGEPPFTGPTSQAVIARMMNTPPASLIVQRARIPAHVEEAVLTALEKLPADRWATAAEFAAALEGQRGSRRSGAVGSAHTAPPPPRPPAPHARSRRRRRPRHRCMARDPPAGGGPAPDRAVHHELRSQCRADGWARLPDRILPGRFTNRVRGPGFRRRGAALSAESRCGVSRADSGYSGSRPALLLPRWPVGRLSPGRRACARWRWPEGPPSPSAMSSRAS